MMSRRFTFAMAASLLASLTVAGCGKEPPPARTPEQVAMSNLIETGFIDGYNTFVDTHCLGAEKGEPGRRYIECTAKMKGYAHYDRYYCETEKKSRCGFTVPTAPPPPDLRPH